jgi:hypothetical protein
MYQANMVFRRPACVETINLGEEVFIIESASTQCYSFEGVGLRVWELALAGRSYSAIIEAIVSEYGVEYDIAKQDVGDFIQTLVEANLLELF